MDKCLIRNERPIAIYNCEKKELIGLFSKCSLVGRYLFEPNIANRTMKVIDRLRRKSSVKKCSLFTFPVAVRYCNESQAHLLGESDYVILSSYPEPVFSQIKGFDSTRESYYKEFIIKNDRRLLELYNGRNINA